MTFTERVREVNRKKNSLLCVGLDPVLEQLPPSCRAEREPLCSFCKAIVAATADLAAAFKINTAFFEAHGSAGWRQLERLVTELPGDVLRIADAKRGDVGHSAEMYRRAFFDHLAVDALTVNPLLGSDSVEPFLRDPRRGAFFLCLTSNPGGEEIQLFSDSRRHLYEHILDRVRSWNTAGNAGIVAAATQPERLHRLRAQAPELPFLIPGVGAQGGDLAAAVEGGISPQGDLALINVSRAILYRSSGDDFAEAARAEASRLRDEINRFRSSSRTTSIDV